MAKRSKDRSSTEIDAAKAVVIWTKDDWKQFVKGVVEGSTFSRDKVVSIEVSLLRREKLNKTADVLQNEWIAFNRVLWEKASHGYIVQIKQDQPGGEGRSYRVAVRIWLCDERFSWDNTGPVKECLLSALDQLDQKIKQRQWCVEPRSAKYERKFSGGSRNQKKFKSSRPNRRYRR
jgi:hypothetical protein